MADRIADRIGNRDITHVIASPLERAQETAAPLAAVLGLSVEIDERIVATPVDTPEYAQLVVEREAINTRVQAQRNELESQLADYQQRLQILQLSERLTTTGGVQILNPASVPSTPISPTIPRDLIQAALKSNN